ncbi:MAG: exosortase-associated EpsI family protein [Gemmataceae bacterium]
MRFPLSQLLLYAALLALILGGGVVYGLVTDRWAPAAEEVWPNLERLSLTIGPWDGRAIETDPEEFPPTTPEALLLRRYVHRVNGTVVTLFLTAGRPGPMVSAHQPDSCYPGAGYQFAEPMTTRSLAVGPTDAPLEFRVATFSKTERALPIFLRVYWSFSASGEWRMPDNPRLAFAGQRRVYKLYVIRQLKRGEEPLDGDAAESFLRDLAPEMQKVIFAPP